MRRPIPTGLQARALLATGLTALVACSAPEQMPTNGSEPEAVTRTEVVPPASPPNIVIYLVDTLRADHLSLYGYARNTAPELEDFARSAIRFDNAFSPSSWTRPSVGSLLTGLYPIDHGAISRPDRLRPDALLLPEYLTERGYTTAAIVTNPNVLPIWGFGRGFDDFVDVESIDKAGRSDLVNREVFRFLDAAPQQPFFLYIHTRDPHDPYDPPAPWDSRFAIEGESPEADDLKAMRSAYDGEIAFNDHHFGALVDRLRELGLYEDSLIVFVSDHGEQFGERGQQGHGHNLHDETVRVPLVIKFPGNAGAGETFAEQVSLLDILPTLFAQVGIESPPGLPGTDVALLLADGDEAGDRALFFDLDLEIEKGRYLADGVMVGERKMLRQLKPRSRPQLFDVVGDAGELDDLAETEAGLVRELVQLVEAHRAHSSTGIHFQLLHDRDNPAEWCRVRLSTDGLFVDVDGFRLEPGDRADVTSDGRGLEFVVEQVNYQNPSGLSLMVDSDHLRFDLDPVDARLVLEDFTCDQRSATVCVGDRALGSTAPEEWRGDGDALLIAPGRLALFTSRVGARTDHCRAFLGRIEGLDTSLAEGDLDPEIVERLRALGYVD